MFYYALSGPMLFYSVLFYSVLFYSILFIYSIRFAKSTALASTLAIGQGQNLIKVFKPK